MLSADGSQLFATNENPPQGRDPAGQVSSFAIGGGTERSLTPLSQVATRVPSRPMPASATAPPGGSLAVIPVTAHGTLGAVASRCARAFPGAARSARAPRTCTRRWPAATSSSPTWAPTRSTPIATTGKTEKPLQAARPAPSPCQGSGPRHLAFDKSGTRAYLTLELSNQIAILGRDEARLEQQGLVDLDPPGANAEGDRRLGAIHLSPDERFLYVARRGVENQIVVYAVSPADGSLSEVQRHASGGEEPREFTFAPDGRFLLVANQKSDSVAVFARDPQSGLLVEQVQSISAPAPSALRFVP